MVVQAKPAVSRDRYHQYTYEGVTYPGVTGIIKILDKSDVLMNWAARQTAEAAINLAPNIPALLATSGKEGVVKLFTARSSWKNEQAKLKGTEVHAIADLVVNGKPTGDLITDAARPLVDHYVDWWQRSGWKIRLSEAYVIDRELGYGGTFDLLAYDMEGETVLADVKTGSGVFIETILQLAAYGMAELVNPVGSELTYPMPRIDRHVVLHVSETGVREIELEVSQSDREAFGAALVLSRWRKSHKENRL
ncbi:MAG: hypothetical protein ACRDGQ_01730 [Candidatus Limnocylindrales bacterium]